MSVSVNKVILVGNVGTAPEASATKAGKSVANFSVATQGFKDDETTWHKVVVWDKLADSCVKYLAKGRQVYVEGRIQNRTFEGKNGDTKYITEIVANEVKFLGAPTKDTEEQPF